MLLFRFCVQKLGTISHVTELTAINKGTVFPNSRVTPQYSVRVTDGALSCDLFPADYQLLSGPQLSGSSAASAVLDSKPVAWMALETILDDKPTMPSDVVRILSTKAVKVENEINRLQLH